MTLGFVYLNMVNNNVEKAVCVLEPEITLISLLKCDFFLWLDQVLFTDYFLFFIHFESSTCFFLLCEVF